METAAHSDEVALVDGLVVANWSPEILHALRKGRLALINATCAVWEDSHQTLVNVGRWLKWFDEYPELIVQARSKADLRHAADGHRTSVVLGFQNTSPLDDRIELLAVYKALGVGIIQLTYNTSNYVGSGCYESTDRGLTDFGRDVVAEMNRLGIAIDLSHVGKQTASDVLTCSKAPTVFSHVVPTSMKQHARNKDPEQLQEVALRGGLVAGTVFPTFLRNSLDPDLNDVAEVLETLVDLCGEDHVGFASDSTQGHGQDFFDWIVRDKGFGRKLTDFGAIHLPRGLERIEDLPNLVQALIARGWRMPTVEKVMGRNWLEYLDRAWTSYV